MMHMKAIILEGIKQLLSVQETPRPAALPGEVVVHIKAAALNHRDYWIQQGLYAGLKFPFIPGSDGAGIVVETGAGTDKAWLGKEVIVNPGLDWGDNPAAQQKSFRILGLPDHGTFAEYLRIPATYLYERPQHLNFIQSAAIPLAGLTAYRALFTRACLQPGETVLITGIGGGVALFALQFALTQGAKVYVSSGSEAKIASAIQAGASGGINYKAENWWAVLQEISRGIDVIIDGAAGEGFGKLVDLAKPGGRIVVYGGTAGKINELIPQKIFYKQLSILGTTMGRPDEFDAMLSLIHQHKMVPIIDEVFPFFKSGEALAKMEAGRQFGKIVLSGDWQAG
jgi:zinc-binding alcohol dehydrogenase/oxidoreductase